MNDAQDSISLYEESLSDFKNRVADKLFQFKDRNVSREIKTAVARNIDDRTFDMLKRFMTQIRTVDNYSDYKKLFDALCRAMKIPNQNCVFVSEEFKKGTKGNDNTVIIKYSNKTKKIIIPAGYTLYHQTTQDLSSSRELRPTFRGKAAKGYLYSSPRVYFSLRKLPKIAADITKDQTTSIWVPKEKIQVAYVDPLLPNAAIGAIYVETSYPIAVKPYVDEEAKKESVEDGEPTFESLDDFMEYYGLTFADDDVYEEGVRATIGKYVRKNEGRNEIKKRWEREGKLIGGGDKTVFLRKDQFEKLRGIWEVAKKTTDFSAYKNAFSRICRAFGLPSKDIVIDNLDLYKSGDDEYTGLIRYNNGRRKVVIPNGVLLIHRSSVSGITVLKPSFKSRTEGRFLYSTPRVYFTLGKPINPEKGGMSSEEKMTTYTPSTPIQTAYIDPAAKEFSSRAVFVETTSPIQVTTLEKFSQRFFDKLLDKCDRVMQHTHKNDRH